MLGFDKAKPIIRFIGEKGEEVILESDIHPQVVEKYCQQQLNRLKTILAEPAIKEALNKIGISGLSLELDYSKNLVIGLQIAEGYRHEEVKDKLLELLDISGAKIKILQGSAVYIASNPQGLGNHTDLIISTREVQKFDAIIDAALTIPDKLSAGSKMGPT